MKHLSKFANMRPLIFALLMPFLLSFSVLSANANLPVKDGKLQSCPVEDSVHIYKGALVCINAAGYIVPAAVTEGYRFVGVAYEECDNTLTGHTQGGKSVRVSRSGVFRLPATSITQAMVGQMMYVVDDATVDDVAGAFVISAGVLVSFESTTVGWVDITVANGYYDIVVTERDLDFVTKTASYSLTAKDSGKVIAIATDALVMTLPSTVKGIKYTLINTGTNGNNLITISPAAADRIGGGALGTGVDNKDLINTKATSKYGDLVTIVGDGADGWVITKLIGVWAKEA